MAAIAWVVIKNGTVKTGRLDQPGLSVSQLKRIVADQYGVRPRDVTASSY